MMGTDPATGNVVDIGFVGEVVECDTSIIDLAVGTPGELPTEIQPTTAVDLPDGKSLALGQGNVDAIWEDPLHFRLPDPVQLPQGLSGGTGIKANEAAARLDANGIEHLLGVVIAEAGNGNVLRSEAHHTSELAREIAEGAAIVIKMPTRRCAVEYRGSEKDDCANAGENPPAQRLHTAARTT